jgi:hypothetical protein
MNIICEDDLRDAMEKVTKYNKEQGETVVQNGGRAMMDIHAGRLGPEEMKRRWLCSIIVIISLALCSCSASVNYRDAKNATDTFHHLFDSGQYVAIYSSTTEGFQKNTSRDTFIGYSSRVNRKMGKCAELSVITFARYQTSTSGSFVIIKSSRTCANGNLDEEFVWQMIEGKAMLFEYSANNPLLLTD